MSRWLKILGVVTILLGLVLLWSPRIAFTTSDRLGHTRFRVRREKVVLVPRSVAALIVAAGVGVFILGTQKGSRRGNL